MAKKPPKKQKTASSGTIEKRREAVAHLRVRGLSTRAIAAALAECDPPFVRADGRPHSHTTIANDVIEIVARWRENAQRDIAEHQAEQLAVLAEVQREGWRKTDLDLVLRAHDRIARLLGTDAPEKHDHRVAAVDEATAQAAFERVTAYVAKTRGEAPE